MTTPKKVKTTALAKRKTPKAIQPVLGVGAAFELPPEILHLASQMNEVIENQREREKLEPAFDRIRVAYFKASKMLNVDPHRLAHALNPILGAMHETKLTPQQAMTVLVENEVPQHP